MTVPFVGGNGFNSPQAIEIAGDAANGLIVATPYFGESTDPKIVKFNENYEAEYGKKPDQFAAQAYDALLHLCRCIEESRKAMIVMHSENL